jgi:hypothetical protein
MGAVVHGVQRLQGFLVEGVQFGHGQHIGFGQFKTPAIFLWTALSKTVKKNETLVEGLFLSFVRKICFGQNRPSKPVG